MVQNYRFGKERCIKYVKNIWEWQKKRQTSAIRRKKVVPEIYVLNAYKLGWEVNLLDFYAESIAFRVKILINVTLF